MSRRPRGTVVKVPNSSPFGFIKTNAHADNVFVHKNHMPSGEPPREGQELEFDIVETERGPQAQKVRHLDSARRPAPYTFVPVNVRKDKQDGFSYATAEAVSVPGHDGRSDEEYVSGQLFLTLTAHTPLLVGSRHFKKDGKSIVAPWRLKEDAKPVVLAGSSLKGMIRHHLSALLNAPMERVEEQYFSYRPNAEAAAGNHRLRRRCIVIRKRGVGYEAALIDERKLESHPSLRNVELELPRGIDGSGILENLFAGRRNERVKRKRKFLPKAELDRAFGEAKPVPEGVIRGYLETQRELADGLCGHLSSRHPLVSDETSDRISNAKRELKRAAEGEFLNPGYLLYGELEFDADGKRVGIVSLGHHFRYRWGYRDSLRKLNRIDGEPCTRPEVTSRNEGIWKDSNGSRQELTATRALFGYVYDERIHEGHFQGSYQRLAGRITVNHALEILDDRPDSERFLRDGESRIVPLKELGSPKASAVEFYVQQDREANARGLLSTYGDTVEDRETPPQARKESELSGRKFYRHQPDAAHDASCYLADAGERSNELAPLALDASRPNRRFCFTLRFQDLDRTELGALLFVLGVQHADAFLSGRQPESEAVQNPNYALKLGFARPLGWGSVTLALDKAELIHCETERDEAGLTLPKVSVRSVEDLASWRQSLVESFLRKVRESRDAGQDDGLARSMEACLNAWTYAGLARAEYPRSNSEIYTFHSNLRTAHAKNRRRANGGRTVEDETALTDPARR